MTTIWDSGGNCGCSGTGFGTPQSILPNYVSSAVAGLGTPNSTLIGNKFIYATGTGVINQVLPAVSSQSPETFYEFWNQDGINPVNLLINPIPGTDQFLPNIPISLVAAGSGVRVIADPTLLKWRVDTL